MSHLSRQFAIPCNNATMVCHACQLGKHVRLPFSRSQTICVVPFQLLHCDLWTSPVTSNSGYKYYLVIVDDFSHYMWTFPLRRKSDTSDVLINFIAYARTQFNLPVVSLQTDNGTEFVNSTLVEFLARHGIHLRMSCPYTSPQNGKAERALRTLNDITRTLLFQAHMPPSYWAEALAAATYLVNRRPCQPLGFRIPYTLLYQKPASYSDLRVFGCLCYPNQSATTPHKLAPRSTACVFLGYPTSHRGYRCLEISSRRVITSRHVIFDENNFPFAQAQPVQPADSLDFLLELAHTQPITPVYTVAQPSMHVSSTDRSRPCSPEHASSPAPASTPASSPRSPAGSASPFPSPPSSPPLSEPSSSAATTPPTPPPPSRGRAVPAVNTHTMLTRTKHGVPIQPKERLNISAVHSTISPIPKTYRGALQDPHWRAAMHDEYTALLHNRTWSLVPRPVGANIVSGKWIFKHKFASDGGLARYKAR
jgi:hypothetical protein